MKWPIDHFNGASPRERTRKTQLREVTAATQPLPSAVSPMVRWHLQNLLLYREVLAISFFDLNPLWDGANFTKHMASKPPKRKKKIVGHLEIWNMCKYHIHLLTFWKHCSICLGVAIIYRLECHPLFSHQVLGLMCSYPSGHQTWLGKSYSELKLPRGKSSTNMLGFCQQSIAKLHLSIPSSNLT